jgi:hypothetical protein
MRLSCSSLEPGVYDLYEEVVVAVNLIIELKANRIPTSTEQDRYNIKIDKNKSV